MTVNHFVEPYERVNEQDLWNDLIVEAIQMYGHDVRYIPRHLANFDQLFVADDSSRFDAAYTVEMQVINVLGFGGDKDFYSQFGHQIRDELVLSVSRDRWQAEVGAYEGYSTPKEGDLIWVGEFHKIFVIKYVDPRENFYQLGKLYTWELTCEVFEYSSEEFDTGDREIDQIDLQSIDAVAWALTDENGNVLTDENGNILTVDGFSTSAVDPDSENDYLPPELANTADLNVAIVDPFDFLQGQSEGTNS